MLETGFPYFCKNTRLQEYVMSVLSGGGGVKKSRIGFFMHMCNFDVNELFCFRPLLCAIITLLLKKY